MVKLLQSNLNVQIESSDLIPEQKLWKAVLCQMLYDALSDFENKAMSFHEKKLAENWFLNKSKDFFDVCNNAGFDPMYIHEKVKKLLNLKRLKKLGIVWNHTRKAKHDNNMPRV
jgi:hypothetical protein